MIKGCSTGMFARYSISPFGESRCRRKKIPDGRTSIRFDGRTASERMMGKSRWFAGNIFLDWLAPRAGFRLRFQRGAPRAGSKHSPKPATRPWCPIGQRPVRHSSRTGHPRLPQLSRARARASHRGCAGREPARRRRGGRGLRPSTSSHRLAVARTPAPCRVETAANLAPSPRRRSE